jgi:hypothetical protein
VALEDSLGLVSSDAKPAKAGTPNFEELAPVSGLWALSAFSLIELMIAIALLSLIVLGLLSMFTQTQRAFRDSMKQTDVQEAGRIAMDMLVRELEQITPSEIPGTVNFFTEVDEVYFGKKPMLQDLPGNPAGQQRTNLVQHFFFMSKVNQGYIGTGYQVIPDYPNGGVGSLYRYTSNTTKYLAPTLFRTFANLPAGMTKIADGVVHFRVVPFDTNGIILSPSTIVTNTYMFYDPIVPDQLSIWFSNNAVPAYLQMELAVLEPHILDRFRAMAPNTEAQKVYLSNHVGQVHLFRQRIPVRNVDFQAYK